MELSYDLSVIRKLVQEALSGQELSSLCFDYFHPVYDQFVDSQTKGQRVLMLVDYAERNGLLEQLLERIRTTHPNTYSKFKPRLRIASALGDTGLIGIEKRQLPSLRNYVFISDRKINLLFQQIPSSFIKSFDIENPENNQYAKCAIVSAYLYETDKVGSIKKPKEYFSGNIHAKLLVTNTAAFFGKRLMGVSESDYYVGLSGRLEHMIGSPFEELNRKHGGVGAELRERLGELKAQYFELNSSTSTFHSYLGKIEAAESRKGQKFNPFAGLPRRSRMLGIFLGAWGIVGGLPILCVILSWARLDSWALIAITTTIIWAILCAYFIAVLLGNYIRVMMNASRFMQGTSTECAMIKVIDGLLYESEERYDFLAETIMLDECDGHVALLGSPVFVALARYDNRSNSQ